MSQDPFAYDLDEMVGPSQASARPILIGLGAMLGIGVLSALVLMEPPMATSLEVTDEERLARMLALAPGDRAAEAPVLPEQEPEPMPVPAASDDQRLVAVDTILASSQPEITYARVETAPAQSPAPSEPAQTVVRPVSATVEMSDETEPPVRKPAVSRPTAPKIGQTADGPYAIQFGAMSTLEKAEREIARFRLAAPTLFASVETSIESTRLDDGREVNRMRIAGVTRKADARAWCRAFKAQGGSCYVVG